MKKLKMGCLLLFIVFGVVVVIIAVMSAGSGSKPGPVESVAITTPAPDQIEAKYGMSEGSFKSIAYDYAKSIVRQHFHLPGNYAFPWTTVQQVFFEFEKRDDSGNLIGEWIGVNVNNKIKLKQKDGSSVEHVFYGTFHYDPKARKWHCSSFSVDGEKLNVTVD